MGRQLSDFIHEYPTESVAYEFMNEPVADNPQDWNDLIAKVRELEPERFLVIGSNMQQSIYTFDDLQIPEDDPYIILSIQCYLLIIRQCGLNSEPLQVLATILA